MVKVFKGCLYACILLIFVSGVRLPPKIDVSISQEANYENEPIIGAISVFHTKSQLINESSFELDQKSLKVIKEGEEHPEQGRFALDESSDPLVVTKYRFELPPKEKGLYTLNPITVQVGGLQIQSNPLTYEVIRSVESINLRLSTRIIEQGNFYPGEEVTFETKIYFRIPIALTREDLSLLKADGFLNVGAPKIDTYQDGLDTVQQIVQKAQAQNPGKFAIPDSIIEGYPYYVNQYGDKIKQAPLLKAVAKGFTVSVLPFPEKGRPESFNGALGIYQWQVRLLSSNSVQLGENIRLEAKVAGSGQFETVKLPDFMKQKGFQGNFRYVDKNSPGSVDGATKFFQFELQPIKADIKEIPKFEFSSFDPISETYVTRTSNSIAIKVTKNPSTTQVQEAPKTEKPMQVESQLAPIDINGNVMLEETNLQSKKMDTILLTYAIFVLGAILGIEIILKKVANIKRPEKITSRTYMLKAIQEKQDKEKCCSLLYKGLLLGLYEFGLIKTPLDSPQDLPQDGFVGQVKSFLTSIEQKQYGGANAAISMQEIIDQASDLYNRMKPKDTV